MLLNHDYQIKKIKYNIKIPLTYFYSAYLHTKLQISISVELWGFATNYHLLGHPHVPYLAWGHGDLWRHFKLRYRAVAHILI